MVRLITAFGKVVVVVVVVVAWAWMIDWDRWQPFFAMKTKTIDMPFVNGRLAFPTRWLPPLLQLIRLPESWMTFRWYRGGGEWKRG